MSTDYILSQLKELASHLDAGETIKISSGSATLTRWGRIKSLGFVTTAAVLDRPVAERVHPFETPQIKGR